MKKASHFTHRLFPFRVFFKSFVNFRLPLLMHDILFTFYPCTYYLSLFSEYLLIAVILLDNNVI